MAFLATHRDPAKALSDLVRAVPAWLRADLPDDERDRRWAWVQAELDTFLSALTAEDLSWATQRALSLHTAIAMHADLARRKKAWAIERIWECLVRRFSTDVPTSRPLAPDDAEWETSMLRACFALGVRTFPVEKQAERLRRLLEETPAWLIEAILPRIGELEMFGNYREGLGMALVTTANAQAVFADSLARWDVERLWHIFRAAASKSRPPGAVDLEPFLAYADQAADDAGLGLMPSRFANIVGSNSEDTEALFGAYLNARPKNHEDVFELLSYYSEVPEERAPLPEWSGFMISVGIQSSMKLERGQSLHRIRCDFDGRRALTRLKPAAAEWLVKNQPDGGFALDYVRRLIRKDATFDDDFMARITTGSWLCARLQAAASDKIAALIFDKLGQLAGSHPRLGALHDELAPTLVPKLPTEHLGIERIWQLNGAACRAAFRQELVRRLRDERSAKHLPRLVHAILNSEALTDADRRSTLGGLDARRFVPSGAFGGAAWVSAMVELLNVAGELIDRIVGTCMPAVLETLYRDLEAFDTLDQPGRAPAMLELLRRITVGWHATDPVAVAAALREPVALKRDFTLFLLTGLGHAGVHCSEPEFDGGSEEELWLDFVAVAAPGLEWSYLVGILDHSPVMRTSANSHVADLESACSFLSNAFRRASMPPPVLVWRGLELRLAAQDPNDREALAAVTLAALRFDDGPARIAFVRKALKALESPGFPQMPTNHSYFERLRRLHPSV
ncbi:MAG: hypothetical protein IV100_30990 [Myxococcales bacterium]|nr:hypothetical protein [Myxococcales bacterium]